VLLCVPRHRTATNDFRGLAEWGEDFSIRHPMARGSGASLSDGFKFFCAELLAILEVNGFP